MITSSILMAEGFDSALLAASVDDLLSQTAICSMATVTTRGESWISTARFSYAEDIRLFFISSAETQHSLNLARNPSIAVAVFDSDQIGLKRGLQIFGSCGIARGTDLEEGVVGFGRRFDWFARVVGSPSDLNAKEIHFQLYVVRPSRVKICDEPAFGSDVIVEALCDSSIAQGIASERGVHSHAR